MAPPAMPSTPRLVENHTFDEIQAGQSATLRRMLTRRDIELFAVMSGDVNPAHLDDDFARHSIFAEVVGHGMWGAALISTVLGTQLPGPGTIYLGQSLRFTHPVRLGDTVTVTVTVAAKDAAKRRVQFDCACVNQLGQAVITGRAEVIAPDTKIRRPAIDLPEVRLVDRHPGLRELVAKAAAAGAVRVAIVHPSDEAALAAALDAAAANLITPVLVGPEDRIRRLAASLGADLAPFELLPAAHSHDAARKAARLAAEGGVEMLVKGSLALDELLTIVAEGDAPLRTGRRMSHVHVMDVPSCARPLLITDAAINVEPDLLAKRDIVQNAIDVARVIGIERPAVAILSAVRTVDPKLRSTTDAAALCKMAERGQIAGGVLDGPLAFDDAIAPPAAAAPAAGSPVAGRADILVAPDLESANMLARQLLCLADAQAAGVVVGARVPIVDTPPVEDPINRAAGCALGVLLARHYRAAPP